MIGWVEELSIVGNSSYSIFDVYICSSGYTMVPDNVRIFRWNLT